MQKKHEIYKIVVGYIGAFLGLYSLNLFNQNLLMKLPLGVRLVSMMISYWMIAIIPIGVIIFSKEKWQDYGFSKQNVEKQLIVGAVIGGVFTLILTLLPHMMGFGYMVDNGKRYQGFWFFVYEFIYCVAAVGLVEELLFRGFFYEKIRRVSNDTVAVIVSSMLFGFFHLFSGNFIQMITTGILGVIFCICRKKIKNCTVLSLSIAHGIHDAMITLCASLLLT